MPTPVGPTQQVADLYAPKPVEPSQPNDVLGKDAFLKLLVAQLKYQDPSKPVDSSEFMAQTASFTQVEKLDEIAKASTEMLRTQTMLGASGLVGRSVTHAVEGVSTQGTVTGVRFGPDGAVLRVTAPGPDGKPRESDVLMSAVSEVRAQPTA